MNQEGVDDGICFTNQTSTCHQTRDLRLAIFFQSHSFALFFSNQVLFNLFPSIVLGVYSVVFHGLCPKSHLGGGFKYFFL